MERGMVRRIHERRLALAAGACLALLSPMAAAAGEQAKDDGPATVAAAEYAVPIEGFMVLTGRMEVGADRRVSGYAIDRAAQVPDEVTAFLARQAANWHVEFDADVAPPSGAVRFTVRLRASPIGDGLYQLWLDGVHLDEPLPAAQRLRAARMGPPDYPRSMARIGASGIVYMQLLLDADGNIEDVFAEQVDLTAVAADPADLPRYQLEFIASAATAASRWRFKVPVEGPYARARQAVRVPVTFLTRPVAYGQWEYLVRGVRGTSPWTSGAQDNAGAMASTGVQPVLPRMWVVVADAGQEG